MTDIAKRYFVSPKSDEFKGTSDCNGKMCFILSDGQSEKIIDILDNRRNFVSKDFFLRFSLESRNRVKYVVMDMNAAYPYVIKEVLPNAAIVIDRFHIIQKLTRALNKKRIQVMKALRYKNQRAYNKFKRYWKLLLMPEDHLNFEKYIQYPLFDRRYVTQTEVVDTLLSFDNAFRQCYQIYQELLACFHQKQLDEIFHILHTLPEDLDIAFKKSLKYLIKHTHAIKNALQSPYSNGKLEGKNNLIKVFQRAAFGFRNFSNMRRRIFLYEENWHTKQPTKRNCGEKTA